MPQVLSYQTPTHRRLKVFAFDPMLGRSPLHRITIEVPYEELRPGPCGNRLQVVDFDGACNTYYEPVDLDDRLLLLQNGMEPTESDPRFHQQMVYAVAMKALENFDAALGRRFYFKGRRPLTLVPHAFHGANAFYHPRRRAVLFGYFPADRKNPGANLPAQPVFSCLSHDIIAHEVTHAITHRLRRYFLEPTNQDVLAFHEAFSDIVAIFQHFSFQDILRQAIQDGQGDLRKNTLLVQLAQQFGYATGHANSLRSAVDDPDPSRLKTIMDPHERGSVLVAAVFDAFFRTYQHGIQDLLRIASGGTGRLPRGAIHPDLAHRMAEEASNVAQATLRMCIRAFDYLPPMDVTFGDYLRALVTADFELNPREPSGLRRAMVEAFRERGIYPEDVRSLNEDSLLWPRADPSGKDGELTIAKIIDDVAIDLIRQAAKTSRNSAWDFPPAVSEAEEVASPRSPAGKELRAWAQDNASWLHLAPDIRIELQGLHPVFRVGLDGQFLVEAVVQFTQKGQSVDDDFGGIRLRGGTTVIVQANGKLRYLISKPLRSTKNSSEDERRAEERERRQRDFVETLDEMDSFHVWKDLAFRKERVKRLMNLAQLHGRARQ